MGCYEHHFYCNLLSCTGRNFPFGKLTRLYIFCWQSALLRDSLRAQVDQLSIPFFSRPQSQSPPYFPQPSALRLRFSQSSPKQVSVRYPLQARPVLTQPSGRQLKVVNTPATLLNYPTPERTADQRTSQGEWNNRGAIKPPAPTRITLVDMMAVL